MRRCWWFATLLLACGGSGGESTGDALSAAAFPVDAYPAKCGVASIESFEGPVTPWHAASWAEATLDANGNPLPVSAAATGATQGRLALQIGARFTGAGYQQGYVGREGMKLSLAGCATIAADVTLPSSAPRGLNASLVLLLGPQGQWSGAADETALTPGATTTVRLPLSAGILPVPPRALYKQLQGLGLKIDGVNVAWSGTLALDNVRVEGLQAGDAAVTPVGTFGGFVSPADGSVNVPQRNGFLTFSADSSVQGHALRWAMLGPNSTDFVPGMAYFGNALPSASAPQLVFHDWVTLEARQSLLLGGTASVLMSRAFPAVRYTSDAHALLWQTGLAGRAPMQRLAFVKNGAIEIHHFDSEGSIDLSGMSEPWIVLWANTAAGWDFDVPTLLTFQHRPQSAQSNGAGVTFAMGGALGSAQAMPLYGLRRWDTNGWDDGLPGDVIVMARYWLQALAAFPVGMSETYAIDEKAGTVAITDSYSYADLADDWGTQPLHTAAFPPAVAHAADNGYPVAYPQGAPIESEIETWFGWYAYAEGDSATYTLPLANALTREPIALRVNNSAATAPIRAELERVLDQDVPAAPGDYWLGNDEGDADFMCDGWATFLPGSAERAKAQSLGPQMAENTFLSRSVATLKEPVTGQTYLSPSSYPDYVYPWDKEWNSGRQLASLARCAEQVDLDIARGAWPKVLATYRYHRIFFDWATGSVTSSTLGLTELADGMHFAWDGMLGVGRLARKLGDEATWRDAAYRTAREQAALYDAWFQAQWTKDIDYGIGHITNAKLPAAEVETRGAIDGWVEDFGLATLEFKSFWQTTNFLYFDVPAQLSLYRDFGLEQRVRALEYDIMPQFHPGWTDGNAMDPVDQRYYGSNYTSAHLVARALLFNDDPAQLFSLWSSAKGTQAASQWYSQFFHGLAGPTLLSIERGGAPLVEAPVAQVRIVAASWDAKAGKVSVDFQPLLTGSVAFRTRAAGGAFHTHALTVKAGVRKTASFAP